MRPPSWRRLAACCGSFGAHDDAAGAVGAAAEVDLVDRARPLAPRARRPSRRAPLAAADGGRAARRRPSVTKTCCLRRASDTAPCDRGSARRACGPWLRRRGSSRRHRHFTSMRRESSASAVFGRSSEMRAGLSMVKATGCGAGPSSTSAHLELFAGLRLQLDLGRVGSAPGRKRPARRMRVPRPARRAPQAWPRRRWRCAPCGGCSRATISGHSRILLADHSLSASAAGRSMKPPRPSGTISVSEILPSSMAVMRPSFCPGDCRAARGARGRPWSAPGRRSRPCRRSVPTMRSVSSENCSRNSRGRFWSGPDAVRRADRRRACRLRTASAGRSRRRRKSRTA